MPFMLWLGEVIINAKATSAFQMLLFFLSFFFIFFFEGINKQVIITFELQLEMNPLKMVAGGQALF